jgi:hypothetical protein
VLELPKPPWYRRLWVLDLAIVVVVVVVTAAAVLWWRGERVVRPTAVTSVPADLGQRDRAHVLPSRTTAASLVAANPLGKVLWQKTGSGVDHGRPFQAPARWRIVWSFSCQSFASHGGATFTIFGQGDFGRVLVQQVAVKGGGTEQVTGGGRGRLIVDTVCDRWVVKAVAP